MLLINLRSFCGAPLTPAIQVWELATGHEDVYIHSSMIKKWDICAGAAILNSLGGRLTDADGKDIDFKNKWGKFISTHQNIYVSIINFFRWEYKHEGGLIAAKYDQAGYVAAIKHLATLED